MALPKPGSRPRSLWFSDDEDDDVEVFENKKKRPKVSSSVLNVSKSNNGSLASLSPDQSFSSSSSDNNNNGQPAFNLNKTEDDEGEGLSSLFDGFADAFQKGAYTTVETPQKIQVQNTTKKAEADQEERQVQISTDKKASSDKNSDSVEGQQKNPKLIVKIKVPPKPKIGNMKLNKQEIFLKAMGKWYDDLKSKGTLTKKILRRKAISEANKIMLNLDRIPVNWLDILVLNHGLQIYKRTRDYSYLDRIHKQKKGRGRAPKKDANDNDDNTEETPVRPFTLDGEVVTSSGRIVRQAKHFVIPVPQKKKTKKAIDSDSEHDDEKETKKQVPLKKIVDLTNKPPPQWWIDKFRQGIALRRELSIYSTDDRTIVFYDYTSPPAPEIANGKNKESEVDGNMDMMAGKSVDKEKPEGDGVRYAHDGIQFTTVKNAEPTSSKGKNEKRKFKPVIWNSMVLE